MQKVFYAVLALCLFAASAFAQATAGRLGGTVSSPDGVIAGATIVVKDNQTQREQTVVGKEDGTFTFPQLEAGTYTVTITAPGFKTFVAAELKIGGAGLLTGQCVLAARDAPCCPSLRSSSPRG